MSHFFYSVAEWKRKFPARAKARAHRVIWAVRKLFSLKEDMLPPARAGKKSSAFHFEEHAPAVKACQNQAQSV